MRILEKSCEHVVDRECYIVPAIVRLGSGYYDDAA